MKGANAAAILGTLFVLLGVAVAAFFMSAAWEHNPQGEFHEAAVNGGELIHWGRLGFVGLVWSWGRSC